MRPLFSREREVQLTCHFVHSNIPFGLEVSLRVIRALFSTTDNSLEAFGVQESLHFALPVQVVGGALFRDGRG